MEENSREFINLNKDLIQAIQTAINDSNKVFTEHLWDSPLIWKEIVLLELEKLIEDNKNDAAMLANYQVGLAKYLDNFSLDWAEPHDKNNIKNLASKIVRLALKLYSQIIRSTQSSCRKGHEDDACQISLLGPRHISLDCKFKNKYGRWPTLPLTEGINFLNCPRATFLYGTDLYRILGKENDPIGHWWFHIKDNPKSLKTWRKKFAVRKKWNTGTLYVKLEVNSSGLKVWEGKAASQQASSNCILPGGAIQIWLDTNMLKNYPQLVPKPITQWPII